MRTSLKCLKKRIKGPSFGGAGSRFGPTTLSRLAASSPERPSCGLRNFFRTSSAFKAYGSVTLREASGARLTEAFEGRLMVSPFPWQTLHSQRFHCVLVVDAGSEVKLVTTKGANR